MDCIQDGKLILKSAVKFGIARIKMNNDNLENMINKYKKEKEMIMNSLDLLTDNFICDLENIKTMLEGEINKSEGD